MRISRLYTVIGGVKRVGFLVSVSLLLVFAVCVVPAVAQEEETTSAVLTDANIEIIPGAGGVEVIERIELSGVEAPGTEGIEHIVSRSGEVGIENLVVEAGGRELAVERRDGEYLDRVFVSPPEGAGDGFSYQISYRYPERVQENEVPLVVPTVSSGVVEDNVSVELEIPEGEYLHSSFPLMEPGQSESAGASMVSFPRYVGFVLGSSPAGLFTSANMYTALTFAVIIVCVGGLLLLDRGSRSTDKNSNVTDSGEVADV